MSVYWGVGMGEEEEGKRKRNRRRKRGEEGRKTCRERQRVQFS